MVSHPDPPHILHAHQRTPLLVSNFAATAIRCRFVDTSTGSMHPPVSFKWSFYGLPFAPRGPSVEFPHSVATMGRSRLPAAHSPRLVPSLGATTLAPDSLPPAGTGGRGHGEIGIPDPEPEMSVETAGSLRFPSHPRVPRPVLDPGRTEWREAIARASARPPLVSTTVAPASEDFGARSHGMGTRCLRFAVAVARHHARLASGGRLGLPGGIR